MKRLAAIAILTSLALAACDGYDPGPVAPDMRGAAGAAGTPGMTGAGGVAAPDYVPDPAPTCADPDPTMVSTQIVCDAGGGSPTFNANGTQCYYCPGRPVPDTGCAIRLSWSVVNGRPVDGVPHDIFCPSIACDVKICHPR